MTSVLHFVLSRGGWLNTFSSSLRHVSLSDSGDVMIPPHQSSSSTASITLSSFIFPSPLCTSVQTKNETEMKRRKKQRGRGNMGRRKDYDENNAHAAVLINIVEIS